MTSTMYATLAELLNRAAKDAETRVVLLHGAKRWSREQIEAAVRSESQEFGDRVRSDEAREAMNAFLQKRRPDFAKTAVAGQ